MKNSFIIGWLIAWCLLAPGAEPLQPDPVRIVIIPDSQYLSASGFSAQCAWIETNRAALNIVAAIHLGDIIQDNGSEADWATKTPGIGLLTNTPFLFCAGNHDYDTMSHPGSERALTSFNKHLPQSLYTGKSWWHGGFLTNSPGSENSYLLISNNGLKLLLFALEFGPRGNVLLWASNICAAYPDYTVIMATHNYLMPTGARNSLAKGDGYTPQSYGLTNGCDGEQMWSFVKHIPNLRVIVSGHQDGWPHVAHSTDVGTKRNRVNQILVDWQLMESGKYGGSDAGANLMIWTLFPSGELGAETYGVLTGTFDRSVTNQFRCAARPQRTPSSK